MVGARWGDNYGSAYSYNGTFELKNSIVLNSLYHDVWSYDWISWIYFDATSLNSFGRPKFNVHDNRLSQPDSTHHPANLAWNPTGDGPLLAPFMPVPNSNVGIAISSYGPSQAEPAAYAGSFVVRLSTFSSRRSPRIGQSWRRPTLFPKVKRCWDRVPSPLHPARFPKRYPPR
jgi:hypothetical protein